MSDPFGPSDFDPIGQFRQNMRKGAPWDSIVEFATHPSFCGMRLYPRQMTLLKLIYLETDTMTEYDKDIIGKWTVGFKDRLNPMGVQPDIWERIHYLKDHGYTHFPHVQMVLGRRASKGILGGILTAERVAYLYSLGSWQQHFNQVSGQVAEVQCVAPSLNLAVTRQFKDIRNTIVNCGYLREHIVGDKITEFFIRTPGDEDTIIQNHLDGIKSEREIATISLKASTSASTSGRGGTGIVNCYDEYAHMVTGTGSGKTGEEIYDAFQPSLDQFGSAALTYVASSPYSKIGKFYELYQQGRVTMDEYDKREGRIETKSFAEKAEVQDIDADDDPTKTVVAEPTYLVVQLPSWELYTDWEKSRQIPMLPGKKRTFTLWNSPVQFKPDAEGSADEKVQYRRKIRNPEKFKVERGGQFATVQDAYLDENMVDRMFVNPDWREPLTEQHRGRLALAYRAHADPSRTNANFGFCIGHLEDAPKDEYGYVWPHVVIDVLKVWKPEDSPEHLVDYVEIGEEIDQYLTRFPTIKKMSYDQYNSAGFIAHQKRKFSNIRVLEQTFTAQENQDRFEKFKSALNLGWVHAYRDRFGEEGQSLLELELKFLQEKVSGSRVIVDKQDIGPVQTKDLADAVMVVTVDLLHASLDRWWKSLNRLSSGSSNVAGLKSGREQERQQIFESNRDFDSTVAYADPMTRYFAAQAQRDERRVLAQERNRATLERNKLERGRRNAFGGRGAYEPGRTRGRYQ